MQLRRKPAFQHSRTVRLLSQSLSETDTSSEVETGESDADDERSVSTVQQQQQSRSPSELIDKSNPNHSSSTTRSSPSTTNSESTTVPAPKPHAPRDPTPTPPGDSSRASSLGAWMRQTAQSLNSVRPPDPVYETRAHLPAEMILSIPAFLFRPRPPPALRAHVLAMPFRRVLRRYNLFAKLVDDYQRWHGREVFAFWTPEELALAMSGDNAELAAALEDTPSVPPHVLAASFRVALLAAPLLSHLIERYHRDLGRDYFAFFHRDQRGYLSDSDRSLRLVCPDVGDEE